MICIAGRQVNVRGQAVRIASLVADGYEFLDDPSAAIADLRACGERIDLFTFLPALKSAGNREPYPIEPDNAAVLTISTYDHWWNRQINNKTRNIVRRTEAKGVRTAEVPFDDVLVRGIWEIYNECPVRQGKPFWHFGKSLADVREMSATFLDRSLFVAAFSGGDVIGFAKLVVSDDASQAGLMHIVAMMKHREKAPTNALIAQAVRSCAERGISYLTYSKYSYGRRERDSLSDFKQHNGFARVDLPRYYVPLTAWGRIAFAAGLHRRLIDRVPEPIAARIRTVRTAWYSRRMAASVAPRTVPDGASCAR